MVQVHSARATSPQKAASGSLPAGQVRVDAIGRPVQERRSAAGLPAALPRWPVANTTMVNAYIPPHMTP